MQLATANSELKLEQACADLRSWYNLAAKNTAREYQERKRREGERILAQAEARAAQPYTPPTPEEIAEQERRARGRQYQGLACPMYDPPHWAFLARGFMRLVVLFWAIVIIAFFMALL